LLKIKNIVNILSVIGSFKTVEQRRKSMGDETNNKQPESAEKAHFEPRCPLVKEELLGCHGCMSFCPEFLAKVRLALRLSADEISDEDLVVRVRESLALVDKINRGELYSEEELMALEQWGVID
jgi:hypothetical protein